MVIHENYSLKANNTFCVDAKTRFYAEVSSLEELRELLKDEKIKNLPKKFIGDGSNVLFVSDYPGIVIKIASLGIKVVNEDDQKAILQAEAGHNWHDLVTYAVDHEYEGIENMAYIPGTVGGAVAGNIAAYGQNVSDVLISATVYDTENDTIKELGKDEMKLRYRCSIFKENPGLVILAAKFQLNKKYDTLETSYHERKGRYGSLEDELQTFAKPPYKIHDIYEAVIRQRTKRLPNLDEVGNAGSFFRNPTVTKEKFEELAKQIPELQSYPAEDLRYTRKDWNDVKDQYVKVPAGRIIDFLGWRGKWEGNVGVSEKHALCVVTNKQASGKEVLEFTEKIKKDVKDKYGIELESEIDVINS